MTLSNHDTPVPNSALGARKQAKPTAKIARKVDGDRATKGVENPRLPLQRCLVLATALLLPAACVNRNYVGDRCAAGGCVDAAPGRDLGTFEGLDLGGPPPPLDLGAAASDDGFEPADLGSGGSDLAAPSDGGSDLG